jgi:uncharacterized membrane protein HdeD (DUF308 family)
MTANSNGFTSGLAEVRRSWVMLLISGILLMILGVVCIVKAQTATTFPVLVLGWIIVISGVFWLVNAFLAFGWGGFFSYLLNAIIRGVTGSLLIDHPGAGAAVVATVLAVLFIVGGLFRAAGASVIRFPRWAWTVFGGLISISLGVYLLAIWDTASPFFLGIAIGVDLIFDAAALIGFAAAIHSLPEA